MSSSVRWHLFQELLLRSIRISPNFAVLLCLGYSHVVSLIDVLVHLILWRVVGGALNGIVNDFFLVLWNNWLLLHSALEFLNDLLADRGSTCLELVMLRIEDRGRGQERVLDACFWKVHRVNFYMRAKGTLKNLLVRASHLLEHTFPVAFLKIVVEIPGAGREVILERASKS